VVVEEEEEEKKGNLRVIDEANKHTGDFIQVVTESAFVQRAIAGVEVCTIHCYLRAACYVIVVSICVFMLLVYVYACIVLQVCSIHCYLCCYLRAACCVIMLLVYVYSLIVLQVCSIHCYLHDYLRAACYVIMLAYVYSCISLQVVLHTLLPACRLLCYHVTSVCIFM